MNTKNSLQNKLARSYKIFLHNLCKIIPDPARRFLYRGLLALHYCFYSNRMGIIVHVHWQEVVGSVSYTTGNCKMMHHFLCLLITVKTNQVWEYIKTLTNGSFLLCQPFTLGDGQLSTGYNALSIYITYPPLLRPRMVSWQPCTFFSFIHLLCTIMQAKPPMLACLTC